MTTICCNLKMMAGDRKCVDVDLYFPSTKIFKFRGEIVGASGTSADCEKFLEWFEKRTGNPPLLKKEEFAGLALTKKGIYLYDNECIATQVDRDFHAIGSGALGALVAMQDGADPKTAIEKVSMFELNTSIEVDVLEL
ncbi:MAG: hypothetical protein ACRENT_08605 [Thermodesulfobacteriota bacterium]